MTAVIGFVSLAAEERQIRKSRKKRMKSRCLLSSVDRLPTINEMQENPTEDGDLDWCTHTMEDYIESIKELSQPACYPLHGPLRGHRRWTGRRAVTPPVIFLNSSRIHTAWSSTHPSDESLMSSDQSSFDPSLQSFLDVVSRSLFAGLL
ncbi:hypothetical protein OJAV_G00009240 [Oryzias javanicus]|uniref:Uncharacterized protein n=1 Tax=Oryzias javanicus TaxID=123683 RepID=A0A437DMH2_ORYJA|nr:hypothetical protein OJAV_G00009240 [Oryzias javanicus]